MVLLKRAVRAAVGLALLMGCGERDFSTPWMPPNPDSTATVATRPDPPKPKPDTARTKPEPILIESLSASDLRMNEGDTKPAQVAVLPANATSPLYEMTSNKPEVAEVTADGIHGAGAGSATVTVHALDGSGKTTKFHVIVDAIVDICLLPCLCLGKAAGDGKGKDKGKGNGDSGAATEDPCKG